MKKSVMDYLEELRERVKDGDEVVDVKPNDETEFDSNESEDEDEKDKIQEDKAEPEEPKKEDKKEDK